MKTKVLAVAMALAALLSVFAAAGIAGGSDATTETLLGTGSNDLATANYYKTNDTTPIPFIDLSLTTVAHPQYSVKVTYDSNDTVLMEASTVGASTPMRIGLTQYLHEDNSDSPYISGGINLSDFTEYKIWFKASDAASYESNYVTIEMTTCTVTPAVSTTGLASGDSGSPWEATISSSTAISVYAGTVVTVSGSSFTVTDTAGAVHTVTATAPTTTAQTNKYTYAFGGWSPSGDTVTISANTTLTATFTATINQHKVYIDSGISVTDGTSNYVSGASVNYGVSLTINATKTGYTPTISVNGTAKAAGNTASETMSTVDLIITATYAPLTPTVTFQAPDATTTYSSVAVQQTYGAKYDLTGVSNPVRTGYTFAGWQISGNKTISTDVTVDIVANDTAVAQWTVNQYTVSWDDSISSVVNKSTSTAVTNHTAVAYGTPLTITIADKTGYTVGTTKENGVEKLFTSYTVPAYDVVLSADYTIQGYTIAFGKDAKSGDSAVVVNNITLKESDSDVSSITPVDYGTAVLIDGATLKIGTHTIVSGYTGTSPDLAFGVDRWTIQYTGGSEVDLQNGATISGAATIKVYYKSFSKGTFTVDVTVQEATSNTIDSGDLDKVTAVVTDKMLAGEVGILKIRNASGKAFTYAIEGATADFIAEGVYKISGITSDTTIVVKVSNASDANLRAFYISSMNGSTIGVHIETNDDRFPSDAAVALEGMGYIEINGVRTYMPFGSTAYTADGEIDPSTEQDGGVSVNNITYTLNDQWGQTYTAYSVTATYNGDGQTASTSKVLA